jgi:glycopeptide antibiotics resistance protein
VLLHLQLIALGAMHRIPWYKPTIGTPDLRTYKAPETTVIYLINLAQFVILGVVFNKGYPHRCVAATAALTACCLLCLAMHCLQYYMPAVLPQCSALPPGVSTC